MIRTRTRLALAWVLVVGVAAGVAAAAPPGPRDAEVHFNVVPGPGRVTYLEHFATTATFEWKSGSQPTHVEFRQTRPVATFDGNTYPATLIAASCNVVFQGDDAICGFQKATSLKVTTVWQAPAIPSATGCPDCLTSNARFVVKEGVKTNDPNDTFPLDGITVPLALLAGDGSEETTEAGGYEMVACADPSGPGSLHTNQALSLAKNPFATTICEPFILSDAFNFGFASTIHEAPGAAPGHGQSTVCIAALGQNCGPEGSYTPQDFGTTTPFTIVIRVLDEALDPGDTISGLSHNGHLLLSCSVDPTNPNGCGDVSRSNGPVKIWTLIGKAKTNGPWDW